MCVDGRARRARSFRNQYLIYARANLQPYKGGRYVQVARSETDDPRGPYGAFELLRITGVAEPDAQNVYFGAVKQNPLDERTLLEVSHCVRLPTPARTVGGWPPAKVTSKAPALKTRRFTCNYCVTERQHWLKDARAPSRVSRALAHQRSRT